MQSSHPIDFLRKFVRSRLNSNSMLWKNILYIKDLFQSIASHTLLLYDHLLISFQRDRTKKSLVKASIFTLQHIASILFEDLIKNNLLKNNSITLILI